MYFVVAARFDLDNHRGRQSGICLKTMIKEGHSGTNRHELTFDLYQFHIWTKIQRYDIIISFGIKGLKVQTIHLTLEDVSAILPAQLCWSCF